MSRELHHIIDAIEMQEDMERSDYVFRASSVARRINAKPKGTRIGRKERGVADS